MPRGQWKRLIGFGYGISACSIFVLACDHQTPSFKVRTEVHPGTPGDADQNRTAAHADAPSGGSDSAAANRGDGEPAATNPPLTDIGAGAEPQRRGIPSPTDSDHPAGGGQLPPDRHASDTPAPPSETEKPAPSQPQPSPSRPPQADTLSLTWNLPCTSVRPLNHTDTVTGGGEHQIPALGANGLALTFTGTLCAPSPVPRDLVFVVDVTGSMGDGDGPEYNHDPHSRGSCGRLEAIRRVLAMLPQDRSAKVSILTFNSEVVAQSRGFFGTADALFTDLARGTGETVDDVICAADGDTDYRAALRGARDLLNSYGRAEAQKEIYFISDGLPTVNDGVRTAEGLRADGVMIASIMLIGDETIMRDKIASRDASGAPLFRKVEEASKLADALAELATNRIAGASLRFQTEKDAAWQVLDLRPWLKGDEFLVPPVHLELQQGTAINMQLDVLDSRGHHALTTGRLAISEH